MCSLLCFKVLRIYNSKCALSISCARQFVNLHFFQNIYKLDIYVYVIHVQIKYLYYCKSTSILPTVQYKSYLIKTLSGKKGY